MEEKRQQEAMNLQRKTDVENENQDRLYQAELAKAQDKARRETEFMNNVGGLINNMQTRANAQSAADKDFRNRASVIDYQTKLAALNADRQSLLDTRSNAALLGYTEEMYKELERRIEKKTEEINKFSTNNMSETLREADEINRGRSLWRWNKPKGNTYE